MIVPNQLGSPPQPGAGPDERSGWRPPGPGDGVRASGCGVLALVVALVVGVLGTVSILAIAGLIFLGGQINDLFKGTVQFGTGGTGCAVTGQADSFPTSTAIHYAAYFTREVPAGETITVVVTLPDGSTQDNDVATDSGGSCIYEDIPAGLPTGSYAVEFRAGTEVLSKGSFQVTP